MRVRSLSFLIIAVLVAGCAGDSDAPGDGAVQDLRVVEINGAQVRTDGSLVVNLNVCNADENVVDVIESDDEVRLTARTDGPKEGDECSDGAEVVLDAPLGTRRLVDEATGNEVVVDVEIN